MVQIIELGQMKKFSHEQQVLKLSRPDEKQYTLKQLHIVSSVDFELRIFSHDPTKCCIS